MNRVTLLGNLGADAEVRHGQNAQVVKLRLCTTKKWKDAQGEWKENSQWHSIVMFRDYLAKKAPSLKKGSRVFIEGELSTSSYEKDGQKIYKTEIIADTCEIIQATERQADQGGPTGQPAQKRQAEAPRGSMSDDGDGEDIPF